MTIVRLTLVFPHRDAAHAFAGGLAGLPEPPDVVRPDGTLPSGVRWNVDEIGEVRTPVVLDGTGETIASGGELLDGYFVNVALRDPPQSLLDALQPFVVDPVVLAGMPWFRQLG